MDLNARTFEVRYFKKFNQVRVQVQAPGTTAPQRSSRSAATKSNALIAAAPPPLPCTRGTRGRGPGVRGRARSSEHHPEAARPAPHPDPLPGVPGRGDQRDAAF